MRLSLVDMQGAGKSHVMHLLAERGIFPMESFVQVDPDRLRRQLPEMQAYVARDPGTAGSLTHKEVRFSNCKCASIIFCCAD